MDNEVSPSKGSRLRRIFRRRQRGVVPPVEGRTYIHPSELPGEFEKLLSSTPAPSGRRALPVLLVGTFVLLAAGSGILFASETSATKTQALPSHVATNLSAVPRVGQLAAKATIQLTSETDGHLVSGGAIIVGSGDVAVTTVRISPHSTITGSSLGAPRLAVRWLGYDRHLGLTYVQLPNAFANTPLAPHHAVESVLVISPYFSPKSKTPHFAYATTELSDPRRSTGDGIVSYLTATSPAGLHGLTGSVAVDTNGYVVAMLAANGQWETAEYIAKVATAWLAAPNCHGRLGIAGTPAEGGGVLVTNVPFGPSTNKLQRGDIITALNESRVDTMDQIVTDLYATPGRTSMVVQFLRHQEPSFVVVRLGCLS